MEPETKDLRVSKEIGLTEAPAAPAPDSLEGKTAKRRFSLFQKKAGNGKKKGKKTWVVLIAVLAVAAVGIGVFLHGRSQKVNASEIAYTTAEVTRQSVSQTLSGSGTLEPANSYTVTSLVSGEVLTDTFEEGDTVAEGDVLYTLDSSSAASNVTQANNSVTQAQMDYKSAVEAKYPTATISGTVSEISVHSGDSVKSGDALCTIIGSNNLVIDFSFTYTSSSDFYVGQSATVYISGFEGTVTGKVTAVSGASVTSSNAMKLCTVRVEVANPGLVTSNYTAQAVINGNSSYGNASITLSSTSTVYASGSGTVKNFNLLAGDAVTAGTTICTIQSDSVDNQITKAQISLDNAKSSVSNAQDNVDNYSITAPISGKVIEKNVKAGDNLSTSGSAQSMAVIYDLTYLKIDMAIDELDISGVQEGQTVTITADAVDGTFTGYVSKVSIAGTTSSGVTTYPVTVMIEDYGNLLPGMNVSAEIVVSEASDVLTVPNAAINRGNTVLITSDSPSASNALGDQTAPDGYVYVQVETGVSDDNNIEVTSGLQEGDTVAYIAATASSSSDSAMMGGGMMMGGMSGGNAGGGMPSGGGNMGGGGGMPSGGGPQG